MQSQVQGRDLSLTKKKSLACTMVIWHDSCSMAQGDQVPDQNILFEYLSRNAK
jgi:hypothetical protein